MICACVHRYTTRAYTHAQAHAHTLTHTYTCRWKRLCTWHQETALNLALFTIDATTRAQL